MIKINTMTLATPLGKIVLKDQPIGNEDNLMEATDFNKMMDEWAGMLSGDVKWFKCPSQDNKFYIIPKEILTKSYIQVDVK